MKHYVTILRKQKITYALDANTKREAKEIALVLAENEKTPEDIQDADFEIIECITREEYLRYMEKMQKRLEA
jgi:DNA-binding transcriptional regulator GbsR (MarR family)